jgi:hypothetical protein
MVPPKLNIALRLAPSGSDAIRISAMEAKRTPKPLAPIAVSVATIKKLKSLLNTQALPKI